MANPLGLDVRARSCSPCLSPGVVRWDTRGLDVLDPTSLAMRFGKGEERGGNWARMVEWWKEFVWRKEEE